MRLADPIPISAPVLVGEPTIERFLTIRAAADALGVPTFAMRRAAKAGQFPTYQLGNRRQRVRLSEVVAAIDRLASARQAEPTQSFES
jgi:hypothetical protein